MPDKYVQNRIQLLDLMLRKGWFPAYRGKSVAEVVVILDRATFEFELERYIDWLGKPPVEGDLIGNRFCALEDRPAFRGQACGWPKNPITWHTEGSLPGISAGDFKQQANDTWPRISNVCGADLAYTSNPKTAHLFLHAPSTPPQGFGGPGGVLADAQLVQCGLQTNDQFQSEARYDSERWKLGFELSNDGKIPLGSVIGHEGMHQLGLDHGPSGNWMAPTLSGINTCQPWEVAELQKRYGPRVTPPIPPIPPIIPPVIPPPTVGELLIRIKGETISIPGYRVTKVGR